MKKHKYDFIDMRIICVLIVFSGLYAFLSFRLFDLQINKKHLSQLKKTQGKRIVSEKIVPHRGMIYDCKGNFLAISRKVKSMYCVPSQVKDKEAVAEKLSSITGKSFDFLLSRMQKKSYFSWLKRKLDDLEWQYIEDRNFAGIGFREEYRRFYPKGEMFSHILGFVNIDNTGLEGLERYMNITLNGQEGSQLVEVDAKGQEIVSYTVVKTTAVPGNHITLTLNEVIQEIVNEELDRVMEKHDPVGAVAIVMDSRTGGILAMCSKPSFDPMNAGQFDADKRRNRAITDMYEPGSVFKIITTAAAINNLL